MMPFDLQTPELRRRLDVREKPYYVRVTSAVHLGYRKGKSISRWIVRRRTRSGYRTAVLEGVVPDDRVRANGASVLSYQQAVIRAMNMNTDETVTRLKHCDFCGKPQTEVKVLIAGPNIHICNECVLLCNRIITENEQKTVERQPES